MVPSWNVGEILVISPHYSQIPFFPFLFTAPSITSAAVYRLSIDMVGEFSNWSTWDIKYTWAQTRWQFINYPDTVEPRLSTAFTGKSRQGLVRSNGIFHWCCLEITKDAIVAPPQGLSCPVRPNLEQGIVLPTPSTPLLSNSESYWYTLSRVNQPDILSLNPWEIGLYYLQS